MIFDSATVRIRPPKLDISPRAITFRYHTWPRQTILQISGIIQWVSYTPIQTLCLHLFSTKIDAKWKQIFSNHFGHSQYLRFSALHVHTQFYITKFFFSPTWFQQHGLWRSFMHTQCFAVDKCMSILQLVICDFFCHWVLWLLAQITLRKFALLDCQDPSELPPSQLTSRNTIWNCTHKKAEHGIK